MSALYLRQLDAAHAAAVRVADALAAMRGHALGSVEATLGLSIVFERGAILTLRLNECADTIRAANAAKIEHAERAP